MSRRYIAAAVASVGLLAITGLAVTRLVGTDDATNDTATLANRAAEPIPLELDEFMWVHTQRLFDARPTGTYSLQAGTLAGDAPIVDIEVPLEVRPHAMEWMRVPAVAPPVMGQVVFVADDGVVSEIRRIDLGGRGVAEVIGTLDAAVWSVVTGPDARYAYLLAVERGGNGDAGVLRLALDGSDEPVEVMAPAIPDSAAGETAPTGELIQFHAELRMALDGHHLARRVCADPVWDRCVLDVLDTESGSVTRLPDRGIIGLAGGLLASSHCGNKTCELLATDLVTGDERPVMPLLGGATVALIDGAPVVAYSTEPDATGRMAIRAIGLRDGGSAELYRARPGGSLGMQGVWFQGEGTVVVPPARAIVFSFFGTTGHTQEIALSLTGGTPLALPAPPARIIQGIGK